MCKFQVCMSLSKKKAIHILSVTEDRITLLKEIPLPEPPLHMVMIKFFFLIYSDMNQMEGSEQERSLDFSAIFESVHMPKFNYFWTLSKMAEKSRDHSCSEPSKWSWILHKINYFLSIDEHSK